MKSRLAFLAFPVAVGFLGCSEAPVAPRSVQPGSVMLQQAPPKGTGLAVDIVPNVTLPLGLGGSVTINQAVITNVALVENTVGQIIGLQVTGDLSGTAINAVGGLVGVNAQPFTATANVTSSGPGQCSLATINLSNPTLNVLGLATGTIPLNVTAKGSGAVGRPALQPWSGAVRDWIRVRRRWCAGARQRPQQPDRVTVADLRD